MISLAIELESIKLNRIRVDQTDLILEFLDGRILSVPLSWYPRLFYAGRYEREVYELLDNGTMIHWPLIDEDLTVVGILSGLKSQESQDSLQKWLDFRSVSNV